MKFYIYHIPSYIQKDGSIGKIGVSETPYRRVKGLGYSNEFWEVLEEHTDIYVVSDREKELQRKWGYKIDDSPYYASNLNLKKGRTSQSQKYARSCVKNPKGNTPFRTKVTDFLTGKEIGIWDSLMSACDELGIDRGNGGRVCRGIYKQTKGYRLEYI